LDDLITLLSLIIILFRGARKQRHFDGSIKVHVREYCAIFSPLLNNGKYLSFQT
jgi:hypothetical protein